MQAQISGASYITSNSTTLTSILLFQTSGLQTQISESSNKSILISSVTSNSTTLASGSIPQISESFDNPTITWPISSGKSDKFNTNIINTGTQIVLTYIRGKDNDSDGKINNQADSVINSQKGNYNDYCSNRNHHHPYPYNYCDKYKPSPYNPNKNRTDKITEEDTKIITGNDKERTDKNTEGITGSDKQILDKNTEGITGNDKERTDKNTEGITGNDKERYKNRKNCWYR